MSADTKIAGQGITGASLQKNLTGQFDFNSTNLNLSVVNIKQPVIKLIVNVVANIPEIIHNPTGGALSLLEGVTGLGGGGLMGELKKSPIDTVAARGSAGAGKVELQQAAIVSPAFRADANGTVTLAPVLTNSPITLPVIISLSRPLAEKAGMSVDTNSSYAKLPDFLLIGGTVGSPKADKRKMLVLATAGVKGILNAIPGTGNAGSLVNQLGGLLSGGSQTPTNSTGANQTNKSNNLLQGLNSLLGGAPGANTNTPPGSNTTATNQSPVNNLLNDLLKPKKK